MSGKLDQSLEDIVKTRRGTTARGRGGRRVHSAAKKSATVAPVGGVTKPSVKNAKTATAKGNTASAPASGESKIIVSGLPLDVEEDQIQDYFSKTIGPVKRVFLTYGPNGKSRGVSTVVFKKPGSAVEAATQMNGVKVDNRVMRIEVIVGANQAPAPPPAKTLGDRIAKPKTTTAASQPKSAAATKASRDNAARRGRGGRKGRNAGRGKPKTAEELDAEMTDYFDVTAQGTGAVPMTNGAAAQPTAVGGDTGMEDEIL